MSGSQSPSQTSDSGISGVGSPAWSDTSSAPSVQTSRPAFVYNSSESPGGTFRQCFTVNGEPRSSQVHINNGHIVVGPNNSASGATSNQPGKTV